MSYLQRESLDLLEYFKCPRIKINLFCSSKHFNFDLTQISSLFQLDSFILLVFEFFHSQI